MKSSFKHEHVSTSTTINDRVINGCFLQKETTKGLIHLKAFQVESDSVSFLVTYQINVEIRHENLDGHEIMFTLERPKPALELEYNIPKQFLVSQETCFDHVMIVLSELHLLPSIQERLVNYISTECVNFSNRYGGGGGGFKVEVNVKVNVERWVRIGNCNKESCRIRARNLATLLTAVDCPICLTELGSEVSRMVLQCSHIFHRDCVMKWLKKNPSCPICRTNIRGEFVSIY